MTRPRSTTVCACALGLSVCGWLPAQDELHPIPAVPSIEQFEYVPTEETVREPYASAENKLIFTQPSSIPPEPERLDNQVAPHYSLDELEALSIANNPALAESLSIIDAARGVRWQAGLPPNPTVGYVANEVGNQGSPGQHGAYLGQQIIRGGKLQLSRAVAGQEVQRLVSEYEVLRQRVLTDVRSTFYDVYWLQRRKDLLEQFLETNRRAMTIARQLNDAGDNTKSDVLLAEIEFEQTSTELAALSANYEAKWRELTRVVGLPQMAVAPLSAEVTEVPELSWEAALAMLRQSPRLAAGHAELARNQMALKRAQAEPTPNLNAQVSVQYDFASNDTFAGVQIGMPIPTRNRNQGGIYEANANVRAAMQKIDRIQMLVEKQLAVKYGAYQNAQKRLERISVRIVPKAEEVVRIALEAYEAGELGMADVLNAQRSLLKAVLGELDARQQLRTSHVEIEGYLLADGLGD